ncbi:hypothetical protein J1N35_001960 [Gossypium stocksii]|uniref:Retrotransposon gag domain-containing protein n=1 Tax=Gossypium stocksii TaxID=47602 RepID=A0A9D3WK44_9ROSI|nr:hypothetical protein J1N35_001960 [Gossypium stocksii]
MTLTHIPWALYLAQSKGSMRTFDQLAKLFMSRFLANKTLQQSAAYLMSIYQKENQSLRDFIHCFKVATMTTKGVSNDLAIQDFITCMTHYFLKYHIVRNLPEKLHVI